MKILALLLLLASTGHTQVLPVVADYMEFSGGLNDDTASVYIAKNESPDLLNVVIDEPLGALSQRNGFDVCGYLPSGKDATNMHAYTKINGSRNLILTDNETIWQTSDCKNFVQIVTGWDADSTPRFATIKDNVWATNGTNSVIVWNGSTVSVLDGTSEKPNVPMGKYIAWWKNRVWIGNTAVEPSGVFFSSIYSPSGAALDPAVSSQAWTNTNNQVYFNRGDGSPLYGLKVYRDALYGIKETGLSRLVFQDEYKLNVVKNVTSIGSKFNESFVEMDDGLLRYAGRDGTYKFNGSIVKRTSSKWGKTYESLQQPNAIVANYRSWSTAAQWLTGTAVNMATPYDFSNSITMVGDTISGPNMGAELGGSTNWDTLTGWENVDTHYKYGSRSFKTAVRNYDDDWSSIVVSLYDNDDNLLKSQVANSNHEAWADTTLSVQVSTWTSQVYITIAYMVEPTAGNQVVYTMKYALTLPALTRTFDSTFLKVTFSSIRIGALGANPHYTLIDFDEVTTQSSSYESKPFKAVGLSKWGTMDVTQVPNNSTATYSVRLADTEAGLASESYVELLPGTDVSASTKPWIQWYGTWTTSDRLHTPRLDAIRFNWVTGVPMKSLLSGINYKGRYWMAACITPGLLYNDTVIVESKSPIESHTKYDLPLSAMVIWNDNLYAAIANSSAIARVDYGSTDGGKAITSYWNSRDELYDSPLFHKSINKAIIDYSSIPNNSNLNIGLSDDFGVSYSTKSFATSVSKNPRNTKTINFDPNRALQFRTRVFNNELGQGFKIYGIHSYGTASQFMGN